MIFGVRDRPVADGAPTKIDLRTPMYSKLTGSCCKHLEHTEWVPSSFYGHDTLAPGIGNEIVANL